MSNNEILGCLSLALSVIGYGPYVLSTLRRQIKPHMFSWIIWGMIAAIAFFAQDSDDAGPGAWAMGFTAVSCLVIAALAAHCGEKHITRSDWLSFVGALLAIPLWYVTQDPLWALVLVTAIDSCGYYPTFRKSWNKPRDENIIVYVMDATKFVLALLALEHYSVVTVLSPLFVSVVETALVMMILMRRVMLDKAYGCFVR